MAKSKCWRVSLGERGCRVMIFERKPGGTLYREAYIGGKRVATKKSLGHRDRERAKADGYTLLAKLKSRDDALRGGKVTLSTLFDNYLGSPSHRAKKERTQLDDRHKLERVIQFLGPERDVMTLCDSDVGRYTQARLDGRYGPNGKVRARSVGAELVALRTMLNWATRQRTPHGRPLLEYNPLRGIKLPVEKDPLRPVETYERFLKLMEIADEIDWRLSTALTLAESTGQRISSILSLQRRDIDLDREPHGWIQFRAEHQKTGYEHMVPLTEGCARHVKQHLDILPDQPDVWLFPKERKSEHHVDVSLMSKLLRKAYARAGIAPLKGGLFHPWRRKWVTERKGFPLKDLCQAGGWRDPNTLLTCYMQPDEETLTRVVLDAGKLCEGGVVNLNAKLPQNLPQPRTRKTPANRPAPVAAMS